MVEATSPYLNQRIRSKEEFDKDQAAKQCKDRNVTCELITKVKNDS